MKYALIIGLALLSGVANAGERKKVLILDDKFVTDGRTGQVVGTVRTYGGSDIITESRTGKTLAVIPRRRK